MSVDRILQLKLVADVSDINKKMSGVQKEAGRVGRSFSALKGFVGPVFLNAAISGVEALSGAIMAGISDSRKYDEALYGLTQSVKGLGVSAAEAAVIAKDITDLGSSFGFADDDVIVRGLQALAKETGDVEEAQRWMAVAMDVARERGIPLEDAIKKVRGAAKGSTKAMYELGIEGKTSGKRLKDAEGDYAGAAAGYAETTAGTIAVLQAGIGDVFEDIGREINTTLDGALPLLKDLWAEWQPTLNELAVKFGEYMGKVRGFIDALLPVIQGLLDEAAPLIDNLRLAFETAFAIIQGVLDTFTALLNGDVSGAVKAIEETVGTVVENVGKAFENIVTFASDIIPKMLDAATGIGGALVDGIVDGARALAAEVGKVVGAAVQVLVDAWNSIDFVIPEFSISWDGYGIDGPFGRVEIVPRGSFQLWAQTGDLIPDIQLADGGIVTRPTVALIGEAGPEAVVPLDEYGAGGGVTLNMYVTGDPAVVEGAVLKALRRYAGANGSIRLDQFRSLSIAR